jgi:hypothetical protein
LANCIVPPLFCDTSIFFVGWLFIHFDRAGAAKLTL